MTNSTNENSEEVVQYLVPDIVNSICTEDVYKSVTDRYFSRRYCIDVRGTVSNDHLLLFHSNKICVITLAPSHPIFKKNDFSVNFQVGNTDRTKNAVKGKGKKGGQILDYNSTLCKIKCGDGDEFVVSSCIKGKLIEVNDALIENPHLLKSDPDSCGYIAVVLTLISTNARIQGELLDPDQYQTILANRKS